MTTEKYLRNNGDYVISTDKSKLDHPFIHHFLNQTYWASTRTREQVDCSINNSYCYGMYHQHKQIGFARLITDFVTFGYLADVFVMSAYQKQGLGKWLMDSIIQDPLLTKIEKLMLLTNDAQTFYKQAGFNEYPRPERVMIRLS